MKNTATPLLRCLHYHHDMNLEDGGVVRAAIDMIDRLAGAGVQITLLTHNAQDCPSSWSKPGPGYVRVVTVPRPSPRYAGFSAPSEFKKKVNQLISEHDVVHLHTPWVIAHRLIARIARQHHKPYLITLHGMLDDWCMTQSGLKKRIYLRLLGRNLLEGAAYVHCTAEGEQAQSQKWYPAGRSCVIPYVVDLSPYNPLPTPEIALDSFDYLRRDGIKLLFLSRIHVKKGLERLILACGELKRRDIAFQLGIAGPGEDSYVQQMKALVATLDIDSRTHFLGMVKGPMKLSLYAASDVFVLPTSQENFGLVLPESLLCGTPVVTTKGVDIWPELQEAGAVICNQDASAIANTVESFLNMNKDDLQSLGQRGRQYVQHWLDPDQITQKFVSIYKESMSQPAV